MNPTKISSRKYSLSYRGTQAILRHSKQAALLIALSLLAAPGQLRAQASPAAATPVVATAPKPVKPLDWPQLNRYRAEDASLPAPAPGQQRVVFYGDSITDIWGRRVGTFFPGKPYINRGISGQTTPQMLIRFQQDVVHPHPAAVLILAGTNDIAGNTGPSTPEMIEDNFRSMTAIATQNHIKVILASITPAAAYPWSPSIQPIPTIREVNQWLQRYCAQQGFVYLDYYTAMADAQGAMKPGLSSDGVHPTAAGFAVMAPLAEAAIAQALNN
jgi:lysophospholipase L1-like esterase